jgi:hypothetical protein
VAAQPMGQAGRTYDTGAAETDDPARSRFNLDVSYAIGAERRTRLLSVI